MHHPKLLHCSVLKGILLLKPKVVPQGVDGAQKICRLWMHEVYRVFYDRLVDDADRETFFRIVKVTGRKLGNK